MHVLSQLSLARDWGVVCARVCVCVWEGGGKEVAFYLQAIQGSPGLAPRVTSLPLHSALLSVLQPQILPPAVPAVVAKIEGGAQGSCDE